jgi:hypothetical protein
MQYHRLAVLAAAISLKNRFYIYIVPFIHLSIYIMTYNYFIIYTIIIISLILTWTRPRSAPFTFLIPYIISLCMKYNFNLFLYSKNYSIYSYFINLLSFFNIYVNYFFNNNYSPIYCI